MDMKVFSPVNWYEADRQLLIKMLQEFVYEEIITPELIKEEGGNGQYTFMDRNGVIYEFVGKKRLFDSISIQQVAVKGVDEGIPLSLTLLLGLDTSGTTAGHLMKEYLHTLVADLHLQQKISSEDLLRMDYAEVEGEMNGHPWITYNKGRIGFSYEDYQRYAPERKQKIQLSWIAVHKDIATFHAVESLPYEEVLQSEMEEETRLVFMNKLKAYGVQASSYYMMPIHEWQWDQMIVMLFAADIVEKRIIPLGKGKDLYLAQQSIRTFVNTTNRDKYHVKLPMSILNTLVYRGLPSERTVIAPEVTTFMKKICEEDAFLREECRLGLLGEVATMNVDHRAFSKLQGVPYQYVETLGVVWRESVYKQLEDGEQAITLAALLYVDGQGVPLMNAFIEKSGLSAKEWVTCLFRATLPPLLHYLYQYGTVFSPHGQNTILILKNGIPTRIVMKDFVDDVNISDQPFPELAGLSNELKKVLRSEPPEGLTQFIFTGLFICHFRYASYILDAHTDVTETDFWLLVREEILAYKKRFPHLKERFEMFDLLRPSFTKLTLNRNRIFDYGYADGEDRPHASEYGRVSNALYIVGETE